MYKNLRGNVSKSKGKCTTQCQDEFRNLSGCVNKILTEEEEEQILLKLTKMNIYDIISTIRHTTWTNI